ncbi:MAG: FxsA family protein [Pseudomonadota bacterium]
MSPFRVLIILPLLLLFLELYLIVKVGALIGALPVLLLILMSAIAGVWLLRTQGFAIFRRAQAAMARGEVPALQLLEGVVVMIAAVLLLVPGFLSDLCALLLLIPWLRRWMVIRFLRRGRPARPGGGDGGAPPEGPPGQRVIEGEFERRD